MLNRIWPKAITTPNLTLGTTVEEGLSVLATTGAEPFEELDGEEHSYRVNLPGFELAIHHQDGIVKAVWYNDPAGRLTPMGRRRKLKLYMARYTKVGSWEQRIDNGWMRFFFNDDDGVCIVYGVHNDVIRVNTLTKVDPGSG